MAKQSNNVDLREYKNDSPCEVCENYEYCFKTSLKCQRVYKYITDFRPRKKTWDNTPSEYWRELYDKSEYN